MEAVADNLQRLGRHCQLLVIWTDNDREGENICFEVIKVAQPQMKSPENGKPKRTHIFRAKFSCKSQSSGVRTFV